MSKEFVAASNSRRVHKLIGAVPRTGPSLLACACSHDAVGNAPDVDEFFTLEYDETEDITWICENSCRHKIINNEDSAAEEMKFHTKRLYSLPAETCNHKTTQLKLNRSATLLVVLSPQHLVVFDVNFQTESKKITLIEQSTFHKPLVSCLWHPTMDDVLVVMDDSNISLYYFWDAAIAAQLSIHNTTSRETTATVNKSIENEWFWHDEISLPEFGVNDYDNPFSDFCFGDQDELDTWIEHNNNKHKDFEDKDDYYYEEEEEEEHNHISWEPFTIYVLHHNGNIFAACPIVPRGLELDQETLEAYTNSASKSTVSLELKINNWAPCLYKGVEQDNYKCVNVNLNGPAWYTSTENDQQHRPSSLQATSIVSLRGAIEHAGGYPLIIKSWSNGEIDLIIVSDPIGSGSERRRNEDNTSIATHVLHRRTTFTDIGSSHETPRVNVLLDEMDDQTFYVVGSHEIFHIEFDWENFTISLDNFLKNGDQMNRNIINGYQLYYSQDNQVEGVVPYTVRPGEQKLQILRSDGSIKQVDIGNKIKTENIRRNRETLNKSEEQHLANDLVGSISIMNHIKNAEKMMNKPLPELQGFNGNQLNTPMNRDKAIQVQNFLQNIETLRIKPMQEYKTAVNARSKFWQRVFEWNTNELEKLKKQKEYLKSLVSDVQTKIQECTDSAERNHRLAKECSDSILSLNHGLREEEYIWFGQVNKSVTDVKHLTDRYKDWLASQHLEHKYEQIGDDTIQLVQEINATSDATTNGEIRLHVTGNVPSEWLNRDLIEQPIFYVQWTSSNGGIDVTKQKVIQNYTKHDEVSEIKLNNKIFDNLKSNAALRIIKRTVDFTTERADAIQKERIRMLREEKRAEKGNKRNKNSKSKVPLENDLTVQQFDEWKTKLDTFKQDIIRLKQDCSNLDKAGMEW